MVKFSDIRHDFEQGFRQTAGVDYRETDAPFASTSSIRQIFSVGSRLGKEIYQYGVDLAFLNGYLKEDVYMWPPPGL